MTSPLLIAKREQTECLLLPPMANRHGLITGATGTGKTVSLQTLAEQFSCIGVPVFMADVKGDLSGVAQAGGGNAKVSERVQMLALGDHAYEAFPVTFWDVWGEQGHPVRATVSDMGPLLIGRMLNLNEVQEGVLNLVFKIADDTGMLLLDLKDLRAMLQHVAEHAKDYTSEYGNISAASVGAIQRGLLTIESQGGDKLFGEPMLDINDLMQTVDGKGVINLLAADRLMRSPKVYSTLLLWLLSELFEQLPEAGDLDKPKLVFFFDEAHLLFDEAPKVLVDKVEQVVRLIRSKGVGVYFVSQNPSDMPDTVLGQLGNRIQHALRAYTPRDQKAVKAAAESLRDNTNLDEQAAITELSVGEALVSLLDEKGRPSVVERAWVLPPRGHIGPITAEQRKQLMQTSLVAGVYEHPVDRESAYEKLNAQQPTSAAAPSMSNGTSARTRTEPAPAESSGGGGLGDLLGGVFGGGGGSARGREGAGEALMKSAARAIGSQVGRAIIRGVLGSILGGRR